MSLRRWVAAGAFVALIVGAANAQLVTQVVNSIVATTCTNQFIRSIAASGAGTCATVGSSDLASSLSLTTPSLGVATATTINGASIDNTAWSTYTPSVACGAGTITTSTATGRYKQLPGKVVAIRVDLTVTTLGSCTGNITLGNLPVSINGTGVVYALVGYISAGAGGGTNFVTIASSSNAGVVFLVTPAVSTYTANGTYEAS
jgi:hypothetical protein